MPAKAPKPCRHCKKATTNSNGYCDDHQEYAVGWQDRQKGKTTTQRGYGWKWQKLRKQVLQRDNYLCQPCAAKGVYQTANDVDHIVNKESGGKDELSNLQSICRECHKVKTQSESKRGGR